MKKNVAFTLISFTVLNGIMIITSTAISSNGSDPGSEANLLNQNVNELEFELTRI